MAVSISKLKKETRELHFYVGAQVPENLVTFTYRPNAFTPALEDRIKRTPDEDVKADAFLGVVCEMIASWDVLDADPEDGGKPIEFDANNLGPLKEVPTSVIRQLLDTISEDQSPKKEQQEGSLTG